MVAVALKISKLEKRYANGVVALKGIDLTVKKGDFFALLGPNGAGKSTTIGIISTLVNKTAGEVEILGYNLETQTIQAKQKLGIVSQEFNFNLFEKVIDSLYFHAGYHGIKPKEARSAIEFYLKKLGLWEKRNAALRMLSGGMKRRFLIVRAMITSPEILILDEPTAGVDIELRRQLWDFLREINEKEGKTIILTTHYLEEAEQLCKNIAIINEGNIVKDSSVKNLLTQLTTEHFILDLATPLNSCPSLIGYDCFLVDNKSLDVEVSHKSSLNSLFEQLSNHHIQVVSMRNKTNRLEEIFMNLTKGV